MVETRINLARELDTRETAERPKTWKPAASLPEPDRQPGYSYRWIRASSYGSQDPRNISSKLREGWEPVRLEEQPSFSMFIDQNSKFKDNIEVGGLLLCKIPTEFINQRTAYFAKKSGDQMAAVDNNLMKENDPRMPLFRERKSTTTFGKGN